MKKVLLVAYDINPEIGSECGIANLFLKIYAKYYQVEVFTEQRHEEDIVKHSYGPNVQFTYIENSFGHNFFPKYQLYFISNWFFCNKIYEILRKRDLSNIEFIHFVTPEGVYSFNNLYKLKVKYIIGVVNGGLKSPKNFGKVFRSEMVFDLVRNILYRAITKLPVWKQYYKHAEKIIISDNNVLRLISQKHHSKTFQIFDTLVDPDVFLPNSTKKNANAPVTVLFCGRLIPKKGVMVLLEAFNLCITKYGAENMVLHIAGRGSLLDRVQAYIKNNGLGHKVFIYTNIGHSEIVKKYQEADIFCLPTLREPGGTAILEAMSCQLPVISSNYGGPAYSVTPESGIKIDVKNYNQYVHDLSQALVKLYNNPQLRKSLGENGRQRVIGEFSIAAVERKLLSVWQLLHH